MCWTWPFSSCVFGHFEFLLPSFVVDLDHALAPTMTLSLREVFWNAFAASCQPLGWEILHGGFLGHENETNIRLS
jgi:hypothetical protein